MKKQTSLPVQKLSAQADARIQRRLIGEQMKENFIRGLYSFFIKPVISLSLVLMVGVFGGHHGLEYIDSSPNIGPGHWLYSLKRGREIDTLATLTTPESRAAYYITLAQKRLDESDVFLFSKNTHTFVVLPVAYADSKDIDQRVFFLLEESSVFTSSAMKELIEVNDIDLAQGLYEDQTHVLLLQHKHIDFIETQVEQTEDLDRVTQKWEKNVLDFSQAPHILAYRENKHETLSYPSQNNSFSTTIDFFFHSPDIIEVLERTENVMLENISNESPIPSSDISEESVTFPTKPPVRFSQPIISPQTPSFDAPLPTPSQEPVSDISSGNSNQIDSSNIGYSEFDDFFEYEMDPDQIKKDNQ